MSRTVRFADSSGGSRDSGIGSSTDQGSDPALPVPAREYYAQRNDIRALQDALEDAKQRALYYENKAQSIDAELTQTRKDLREKEAQWRGLFDRTEQLEEEIRKLVVDKRDLVNKIKELSNYVNGLDSVVDDDLRAIQALIASLSNTTSMPEPSQRQTTNKKEKVDPDKKRLSKRFERDDGYVQHSGSGPPVTMNSARPRRRDDYIEPWGPNPTSTAFSQVGSTSHNRVPTYSNVPRSAGVPPRQRPAVTIPRYADADDDGDYHAYPLPSRDGHPRNPIVVVNEPESHSRKQLDVHAEESRPVVKLPQKSSDRPVALADVQQKGPQIKRLPNKGETEDDLREEIELLSEKLLTVAKDHAEAKGRIEALEGDKARLENSVVNMLESKGLDNSKTLEGQQDELDKLEDIEAGLVAEYESLQQDVQQAKSTTTRLKEENETLRGAVRQTSRNVTELQEENYALRGALRQALTHSLREALRATVPSFRIRNAASKVESVDELNRRFAELLSPKTDDMIKDWP